MSNTPMQSYELCDKHPRAHTALETADRRTTLLKAITDVALITNLHPSHAEQTLRIKPIT